MTTDRMRLVRSSRHAAVVALLNGFAVFAPLGLHAQAEQLIGVWKLVSWQVVSTNEPPRDLFGSHPNGYLILTREGRAMVLTTAADRQAGMSDSARAALHRSMLAYTGRYRVEGTDFVTRVDASWNEEWNGTEQRRHFRIAYDTLSVDSAPGPSILDPGKSDFRRIVWVREK